MPIDLAAVNWAYVAILSLFAFVAALLGSLISFRNRFGGAVVAAILFAAAFVYWTYYPHPNVPGPITAGDVGAATAAGPAPAAAPGSAMRPANPVSTMSQAPSNPVSTMSQPPANPTSTMNPPAGAK